MPMLVCTDEEFELEKCRVGIATRPAVEVIEITHGRGNNKEVDAEVRMRIASEALAGVSIEDIKKEYNISASSISAYKAGATSTKSYHNPEAELKKNNNNVRTIISERAESLINKSLDHITDEKLEACSTRDLVSNAKDLSAIIKNITPDIGIQNNNQVVIFKPRMKEEDDYEIIEVNS